MFDGKDFEITACLLELWRCGWRGKLAASLIRLFSIAFWLTVVLSIAAIIKNF